MKLEDIVEHYGTMVATIAHRMIQNREGGGSGSLV